MAIGGRCGVMRSQKLTREEVEQATLLLADHDVAPSSAPEAEILAVNAEGGEGHAAARATTAHAADGETPDEPVHRTVDDGNPIAASVGPRERARTFSWVSGVRRKPGTRNQMTRVIGSGHLGVRTPSIPATLHRLTTNG